jgi:hypothetical protein
MARYMEAVAWIANNDEPGETDAETVSEMISVLLVADLWRKEPEQVADDVLRARSKF